MLIILIIWGVRFTRLSGSRVSPVHPSHVLHQADDHILKDTWPYICDKPISGVADLVLAFRRLFSQVVWIGRL
jgi:hypothetical protein